MIHTDFIIEVRLIHLDKMNRVALLKGRHALSQLNVLFRRRSFPYTNPKHIREDCVDCGEMWLRPRGDGSYQGLKDPGFKGQIVTKNGLRYSHMGPSRYQRRIDVAKFVGY